MPTSVWYQPRKDRRPVRPVATAFAAGRRNGLRGRVTESTVSQWSSRTVELIVHSMDVKTERITGSEPNSRGGSRRQFPTTRWSLILATREKPTTQARDALARLCTNYWYPLYAYVRCRCAHIEDAQDLTQGFF